jgi:hypothetical protein
LPTLSSEAGVDSGTGGVVMDAGGDRDAALDVPPDVPEDAPFDVVFDGLAPCDPEDLFVYLVTAENDFLRYDPGANSFFTVGKLSCTTVGSPFSMGVSREGLAFVVYTQPNVFDPDPPGKLFAVKLSDASCQATGYEPGQQGFKLFGMGFAIDDDLMGETLYVAATGQNGGPSLGLGSIDLNTMLLSVVGPFSENPGNRVELTSSDDGQLYGYFLDPQGNGGSVVRIDKTTAEILDSTHINAGTNNSAFAFAFWSDDFYIFTGPIGGPTTITRYRPADGSVQVVGSLAKTVVGAGVSTCETR